LIRRADPDTRIEVEEALPPRDARPDTAEIDRILRHVSILVVDDEPGMRNFLVRTLGPRCKRIDEAADAEAASKLLDDRHFDLVILDNVMPGQSGLDWLAEQRRIGLFAEAILITGYADLETAIHALRVGAADFLLKPFRSNQILNAAARCMDQRYLRHENFLLKHELRADNLAARGRLIGKSPGISAVRQTLERLARLPTSVLFTGESGTGKEIAARTLHAMSDRADKPFVPVNCAAIPPERIAADLFGGVGADAGEGLLVHAGGGTLFLDEIGELPHSVQATLLRVIEDGRIRPTGAERELPLNLRFMFASNADLPELVAAGRFRRDLYHRINVLTVNMPPLRDRIGDLGELAELFMGKYARQLGLAPLPISKAVLLRFARHNWPGNVRELRNLIERSVILGEFPPEFADGDPTEAEPVESLQAVERRHILAILEACGGNRAEAARRLGVSRKTIDRKCAMWNG
jgi:DNA-binding NtrC family response regulator